MKKLVRVALVGLISSGVGLALVQSTQSVAAKPVVTSEVIENSDLIDGKGWTWDEFGASAAKAAAGGAILGSAAAGVGAGVGAAAGAVAGAVGYAVDQAWHALFH